MFLLWLDDWCNTITLETALWKYRKIPKISPSKYEPPKLTLNRPSKYKTPRGLYLEIALKYKVKQSKNGKFSSNYKASPSKRAFEKYKPRGLLSEFYGIAVKRQIWGISVVQLDVKEQRTPRTAHFESSLFLLNVPAVKV